MKFLVLALCVCAASAASTFGTFNQAYRPASRVAAAAATPFRAAAQATGYAAGSAADYAAKTVAAPVVNTASAVVQPAADAFNYAAKTVAAPVVAAAEYVRNAGYKGQEAKIVRYETDVQPDAFNFGYETDNGISANANGALKRVGDVDTLAIQGTYRYVDNEGKTVVVNYVADENGYQPQSDILPVGPPVPEAIARSLAYIASRPAYDEKNQKY